MGPFVDGQPCVGPAKPAFRGALLAPGCDNAICSQVFRSEPCTPCATRSRNCFRWSLEMIECRAGVVLELRETYSGIKSSQLRSLN